MRRLAIAVFLLAIAGVAAWRLKVFSPGTVAVVAIESAPRAVTAAVPAAPAPVAPASAAMATQAGGVAVTPSGDLRRLTYAHAWSGPQPAGLAEFRDWVGRYLRAGTAAARDALESDGVALARARRVAMRALIERDPETALALTVPAEIRRQLPPAIVAELETRFSVVGDFSVLAIDYGPAELARRRAAGLKTESFQRFVIVDGQEVEASVYGRRGAETSKRGIPLHGVRLDDRIALHEAAVRVLEPGEDSAALPSGGVAAAVGRKTVHFPSAGDLLQAEARFEAAEKGLGPDPIRIADPTTSPIGSAPDAIAPLFPQEATAWTTGNKKVLIIRVDFPDFPGEPFRGSTTYTKAYVQNFADTKISDYYLRSSYGQTTLTNTVTTQVYRMPQTGVYYATTGTTGANTQLHADAQAAAGANHAVATYDRVIVLFRSLGAISGSKIIYGGLADVGNKRVWLNGEFDFRATAHELGHTYGVFHANLWQVTDGNAVSATGTSSEYNDDFDTMGANFADDDRTDFNPWFKNLFGWVADSQVQTVTSNGTYRINRFDFNTATGTLALKIQRDAARNYWVGIRRNFTSNASMQNGAYVIWGYNSSQDSDLLDLTTPGTSIQDAALAVGPLFTDTVGNLSIRTTGTGGTEPAQYADIQVTLGLNGIPVISAHPQSQGFSAGATINLSVVAAGNAPLSYQWRKNTVDIGGATASTYSISNAQTTDAGTYSVRVTNPVGNVLSNNATLTFNSPPVISSPPKNQMVAAGFSTAFSVTVTSGSTPTYQWRRNGIDLSGATLSSLVVSNVQNANAGVYDVVVTNALGQATSAPALLTVMLGGLVPSNDHFSGAWNLPGNFGRSYAVSIGATGESGEPAHYTTGGAGGQTSSVWFRWTPSVSGVAQVDTIGSIGTGGAFFDTVLAVYSGSSLGALTKLGQDDDSGSATSHTSKLTLNVTAGMTYSIVVGGFETEDQGVVALNYSIQTPPAIVVPPASVSRNEGGAATFSVAAVGVPFLIYQWQKNGVAIGGAIGSSLTISPVTLAMSGDQYRCVVNSVAGATTSAAATLTVTPAATVAITSPNHATFSPGVAGSFTVAATGAPAPTFSVTGGTFPPWATLNAATGLIEGMPPNTSGAPFNFTLRADNGVGAAATQAFTLEVVVVPAIATVSAPRQVVALGGNVTLSASATGFPAPTYQWKRNGLPIPGATAATLPINGATARDEGWYQLVASNSSGTAASAVVFVNVAVNPALIVAWGDNSWSQNVPPTGLENLLAVSAGSQHSVALRSDGAVAAWGRNNLGQTAVPGVAASVVRIASGGDHSLALKSDGTVVAWGSNSSGQTTVPAGLNNVVAIAAGAEHSLALKSDGTVVAWGLNSSGQCGIPIGLADVTGVAAGDAHSVAWRADGTVVAWGSNASGESIVPIGLANVVSIAAGGPHNVALKGNGTVVAWGGAGSTVPSGLANVVGVSAGQMHSLALKADGTLVAWGENGFDQLVVPATAVNVIGLASGSNHVLVLRSALPTIRNQPQNRPVASEQPATFAVVATDGGALTYQWRKNGVAIVAATSAVFHLASVQPGDAGSYDVVVTNARGSVTSNAAALTLTDFLPAPTFVAQPANRTVTAGSTASFTVDFMHTGAVTLQWRKDGVNLSGATSTTLTVPNVQAGDAGSYDVVVTDTLGSAISNIAILTVPPAGVVAVAAGSQHVLFLRSDGMLSAAGINTRGQLGNGSSGAAANRPFILASNVTAIAAGTTHSLFLKSDGTLWGMGANTSGQLGVTPLLDRLSPVQIASDVVTMAAGNGHSLFVKSDGSLWGIGSNTGGQLGAGTSGVHTTPVAVASNVVAVAAGDSHSVFVKSDGTLWATGTNDMGQLGINNFSSRTTPGQVATGVVAVSARDFSTLFLKSDGTLWGSGRNNAGQLGNGTTTNLSSPVQMAGGVVAFAAGTQHLLLVKSGGSLCALGNNSFGQFGIGTTYFSQATPLEIAAGVASAATASFQTYYAKSDGSLWAAGTNTYGQLGDSTTTDQITAVMIAAGTLVAPDAPTAVVASAGTLTNGVRLTWKTPLGATRFEVWRSESNSPGSAALVSAKVAVPLFEDLTAVPGTVYYYFVTAANASGPGGFSEGAAGYRLSPAPVITTPPQALIRNAGEGASFTVIAAGTPPFTYQWRKDGTPIGGATGATLTLANVQAGDAGSYDVVVTNSGGSTTSSAAILTVISPATIATPPASIAVAWGEATTLSVVAAGTGPFSYQWYYGASPDTSEPIGGARGSTYRTLRLMETISYWVRVTNAAGSADSAPATVTVGSFAPTVTLTSESGSVYSTAGGTAMLRVRVSYLTKRPTAISVSVVLPAGWTYANYIDPQLWAATRPIVGDTTPTWTFTSFPAYELTFTFAANYPAGLTGNKSVTGHVVYQDPEFDLPFATLVYTPVATPVITTHPITRAVGTGTSVIFSAEMGASGPVTFQWRKDGSNLVNDGRIAGATTGTLTITGVELADAGLYSVVVSNGDGSVTSNAAKLWVIDARATHAVVGAGYAAGSTVTIANTITHPGALSVIGWQTLLPPGWSFASDAGTGLPAARPFEGQKNYIEYAWVTPPPSGTTFTFTLNVPAGTTGPKTIAALYLLRQGDAPAFELLVKPDPLVIDRGTFHSADSNHDLRLGLTELLRVIELYHTRNGTVRTGAYLVDETNTEDGYASDPARANTAVITLAKYHSVDRDHDGKFSLGEILRLIELYNYRSGTVRTGEYHVLVTSEDGFATGP